MNLVAVVQPAGTPQIQFEDGTEPIGFPGTQYYPTLLEATVDVSRPPDSGPGNSGGPTDPPAGGSGPPPGAPEPSTALLLAGLTLGGAVARRRPRLAAIS